MSEPATACDRSACSLRRSPAAPPGGRQASPVVSRRGRMAAWSSVDAKLSTLTGRRDRRAGIAPRGRQPGSRRRPETDATPRAGQAIPAWKGNRALAAVEGPLAAVGALAHRSRRRRSCRFASRVPGGRTQAARRLRSRRTLRSHPCAGSAQTINSASRSATKREHVPSAQPNGLLAGVADDEDVDGAAGDTVLEPRRRWRSVGSFPREVSRGGAQLTAGSPGVDPRDTPGAHRNGRRPRRPRPRPAWRGVVEAGAAPRRQGNEVRRVGCSSAALPVGLVHRARGRPAAQGCSRVARRPMGTACVGRSPASAWASIVTIGRRKATTSTSMRRSITRRG